MNKYGLNEWGMNCGRGKYFSLKLRNQNGSGDYPVCAASKTLLGLRHNQIVTLIVTSWLGSYYIVAYLLKTRTVEPEK
jgi:hypothetical protein